MKTIRFLSLTMLMVLYSMPIPVVAQQPLQIFSLPEGSVGKTYRASIEAVLRDNYAMRLQSDAQASIFRWTFAGGEIPPGLVVRPSGTIVGTPRVSRDEPYRFQVKVMDLAYSGSEALKLDLSLTISAHRIRLTQLRTPRLTPITPVPTETHHQISEVQLQRDAKPVETDHGRVAGSQSAFLKPTAVPTAPFETHSEAASMNRSATSSNSVASVPDTSYDAGLIRPLLRTLSVKPPEILPAWDWKGKEKFTVDPSKEKALGDKIRGPARIELKNLNVLRYDIRVGRDVTFPTAPDLTLPFIPPIPSQPKQQTDKETADKLVARSDDPIGVKFKQLLDQLEAIETEKAKDVNGEIERAITATNTARNHLEAIVTASDSILTTGGGPGAIIAGIKPLIAPPAGGSGEIDVALNQVWPDAKIEELLGRLDLLKTGLLTLPTTHVDTNAGHKTWDDWYQGGNKAAYDYAVARVGELQNQLNGLKSNSTQGIAFQNAQNSLRRWKPILVGVHNGGVEGFNRDFEVGCGFAFDTGKETKVKLIKRDRLADPGTAPVEEEIVTVVCSSPLSVSAGFGFSNVDESEFVLVPSTKTVTENGQTTQTVISRFGFRNKSAFRTLPVALLNTRVWEPNDTFALHVSTGAAVDIKTGQGGTDLEYIVGPSFSFWRSLFVTPGLHIGRVNKLAGGFELGQEVPTGISEPPIEKSWKKAFVTTFTYKIR